MLRLCLGRLINNMSKASERYYTASQVSSTDSTKSDNTDKHTAISDAPDDEILRWDVSNTQTECEICTRYPEIAWSVQQICKKYWPTGYEDIQIARLEGGSFNRIFSLTVSPSAALRPKLLLPLQTNQSQNSGRHPLIGRDDDANGAYILRVSRWEDSEIEQPMQILSYVRLHTDIPVPLILAYDAGSDNALELPYTLQKRMPGVPLNSILSDLTFSQRMDLVKEIASIMKKTQSIEGPAAGKLGFPKATKGSPSTLAVTTTANSTMDGDGPSEFKDQRPITKDTDALEILHFDLPSFSDDDEPYNDTVNTIKASLEGTSVLSFFNFQFIRQMRDELRLNPGDVVCTVLFHRLMQVAIEMDEELDLGTDVFNFYHGDLEPRNIMVMICDFDKLHITGVLDWDLASFVPRAISCLAPRWLWSPDVHKNAVDREDEQDPTDPQAKTLKETFDELMGDDFVEMAYEAHYPLLRRLFRLALNGLHTTDQFNEAAAIIKDWSAMKSLFPKDAEE